MAHVSPDNTLLDKWRFAMATNVDPILTDLDRRVVLRLLYHYNAKNGGAWPSHSTLAKALGVTRRAVMGSVHRLEREGWFTIRKGGPLGATSNRYAPVWERAASVKVANDGSPLDASEVVNGASPSAPEVVNPGSQSGEPRFTQNH